MSHESKLRTHSSRLTTQMIRVEHILYICMLVYFPLLLTSGAVFTGDFRPESLGSPLFRALFMAWLADGFACMVLSIVVLRRVFLGIFSGGTAWLLGIASSVSFVMGILPAYIILELAYKLIEYFD